MNKFIKTQVSFFIGSLFNYFALDIRIEIVIYVHFALTMGYIIGMIDFKK